MATNLFVKGQSGNPKGKPKGTTSTITRHLREALKVLISNELEQLPTLLSSLEPKERLEMLVKLLPYVVPKVDNVKATAGEDLDLNFSM